MTEIAGANHTDGATASSVAERFAKQRRRDTGVEMALRRELHRRGLRYRVQVKVPGLVRRTIDIAFTRRKVAVFVDGCFWHVCPEHATWPRNNAEWWREKLLRNVARDRATDAHLTAQGWQVLRVWEHEDALDAADRVCAALEARGLTGAARCRGDGGQGIIQDSVD